MKVVGRFLVRDEGLCSLFIPFRGHGLKPGIYEIREHLLDEGHYITYIGEPCMSSKRIQALNLCELHDHRSSAMMTEEELKQTNE